MNRTSCALYASVLFCIWLIAGCGGGSTNTINPPPPPPANPVPAITTVMPSFVQAGSADTPITITGTGFISSSTAQWNGAAVATTYNSATSLSATLPAADLTGSSASVITVKNPAPGGGASAGTPFTVNSPAAVIAAISPRYVPPGTPATITVTGTGFESNSVVLWNTLARPTTFLSATTLHVALSATDLQDQGTGSLTVSNPAPSASTSPAAPLVVTSQPVPVIQSVSIASAPGPFSGCPQLQVTITGQNFANDATIQANGISLPSNVFTGNPIIVVNYLPLGFVSQPGALSFTVTNPDLGPIVSNPYPYPATSPAALALCATPSPTTVYAGSRFSFSVQPSEVNISGNGTLTLGTLPTGITATNGNVALPSGGTTLHLQAGNTAIAGTYDLALNGAAGTATARGDFNFTVGTGAVPGFFFSSPVTAAELGVPIGGSGSIQYQTIVNGNASVDYDVTPSVSGLPPGTTATFSPNVFSAGQSVMVTLSASSSAPVTQNAAVTLIGTPSSQVANATASFFADVTQPPGSLPGNRADFVSTAGTPYAAVYDALHNLIFSSNPSWNRVDVISNATHKIIKSVPVRSPRGIDITQDNSTVWVQGESVNVYGINTNSLQATEYTIPKGPVAPDGFPVFFSDARLLALSDGSIFIYFSAPGAAGNPSVGIWNPQSQQMTVAASGAASMLGIPVRSGDGTRVYVPGSATGSASGMSVYNVSSKALTTLNSGTTYNPIVAVNHDGSKLVLGNTSSMSLYNSNLTLLGAVPGTLTGFGPNFLLDGGLLFSADGTQVYEVGQYGVPAILTIDASNPGNLTVVQIAPTANSQGGGAMSSTPTPFAIDATGMILGIQNYGISFDDSTFYQSYAVSQPNVDGGLIYTSAYAGPLAGGTTSSLYAFPSLTPDVWFGQTRGTASVSQSAGSIAKGQLTFTSPPSTTPGPVNVRFIYPDGETTFAEQLFSYSTFPEYAVLSGSSPSGGAPAQVIGYGLPQDPSGGTVAVGSNVATITSAAGLNAPFSAEPIPSTVLNYTFPQGTPGWADLQISTPIGTGTLPKSIFYAKSVTDYSSTDTFTAVLFDAKRNQVYLSAGDHIDVFSTTSNAFVTPLQPAAITTKKEFVGLALTPDGTQLIVADLLDNSVAVINPDTLSTLAIPIPTGNGLPGCTIGPLYVAATSAKQAFVSTGSLPGTGCTPSYLTYITNLQTPYAVAAAGCTGGTGLDASGDGNFVITGNGPCIYSAQSSSYNQASFPGYNGSYGVSISGDGNVIVANEILGDINLNMLGAIARPIPFYGTTTSPPPNYLLQPRLNAAGSLYYFATPNNFEIIDVAHATLCMRFALTETVQGTASPIAIDSGGRFVYLITNQGLTVVDLGAAPLSVGHINPQNAAPGTQVVVRGSGFDSTITATVGGVAASVSYTDQNTLSLTVPAAHSGPEDIVLIRGDGEIYILENGLVLP